MKLTPTVLFGPLILTLALVAGASSQAKPAKPLHAFGMTCSPQQLGPQDELKVQLPWPHGSDFAIEAPDGNYYILSVGKPDPSDPYQPPISEPAFLAMKSITLNTGTAKGLVWAHYRRPPKRIFSRNGVYTLRIAPTLETEDPLYDGICQVDYFDPADHRPPAHKPKDYPIYP
jgi:hypothetical protein